MNSRHYEVLIIGAGGAGMMCAIEAGRRGRDVAILDHSDRIGRKILISGGGRCNFTNINAGPDNYVSENPHFCKSALSRYTPQDFISMVKAHKIAFHEKKLGQLFCDESAKQIVDMLVVECEWAGVELHLDCRIKHLSKEGVFRLDTNRGRYTCDSLVIATGGLSIPQVGATGFGYRIAEQFGLRVAPTAPALDGFVFADKDLKSLCDLSGVSLDTVVSVESTSFRENILFTHTGLSGPASLQASLYWHKGEALAVDLLPDTNAFKWLEEERETGSRAELKNILAKKFPKRFADKFCELYFATQPINQLSEKKIKELAEQLHGWQFTPGGTVGYRKAEVTRGGVDTNELSSKTMESRKVPGLYFIGEVVDVTGQLGGYNFQWAWASGFAAGQSV